MYTFWIQFQDWLVTGSWHIFMVYFIFVWAVMLPRTIFARIFYWMKKKRWIQNYPDKKYRVSALVTVYRESKEDLDRCLSSLRQSLIAGTEEWELLVLLDGMKRNEHSMEEEVAKRYATRILKSNARNKRRNLRELVPRAQGDILVLVDSDTFFEEITIEELCKPFADPRIGGTTTAQLVYEPTTFMQRISNWMENARLQSSQAAASLFKQVACLPGRAIAIRKEVIEDSMDALVNEVFGFKTKRPCISGDDRFMTNVILRKGYRTVLAPYARVTTIAPEKFLQTSKMWIRWGRSSQRYTFQSPWLLRYPFALFIYWTDILLAPATVLIIFVHWPYSVIYGSMQQAFLEMLVFALGGALLSMSIRQVFHLMQNPRDWLYLPGFVLIATWLQVLRTYALFTMFKVNVWGTRTGADARGSDTDVHYDSGATEMQGPNCND